MFPISHSDETVDLRNTDGTDVSEHQDESRTGMLELENSSSQKYDSVTSHLPHKTTDKTTSVDNKSATRRLAGARYRYSPRNRSSFSVEKCHDRQCHDECSYKMDSRCKKVPSNTGNSKCTPSIDTSDEVVSDKAEAAESILETSSLRCFGDNKTAALTETVDFVDCDAHLLKPVVPFTHKQKSSGSSRGKYNVRSRFSGASRYKYSDNYVVQPKHYRGQKANRPPKSVETDADTVCNDATNDCNEDYNRDHAAGSSRTSNYSVEPKHYRGHKSNGPPQSVNKTASDTVSHDDRNDVGGDANCDHNLSVSSKCTSDDIPESKRYRDHKAERQPKSIKAAADAAYDGVRNDFKEDSSHIDAAGSSEVSSKYADEPKRRRNQQSKRPPKSVKATADAVFNDAENDFSKDSNLEHVAGRSAVSSQYTEKPKHYRGYKSNRQRGSVNKAADTVSNNAKNDVDEDSNRGHAAGNRAVSSTYSDDGVSQPRHYRDHKANRQPESANKATGASSNVVRNDFSNNSNHNHAACSPAVSSEYTDEPKRYRNQKSKRPPESVKAAADAVSNDAENDFSKDFSDRAASSSKVSSASKYNEAPKHYRSHKSNRQPRLVKADADAAVSTGASNDIDQDSSLDHIADSWAVSSKHSDDHISQPKYYRSQKKTMQPQSVKTANAEVSNGVRNDVDGVTDDSHVSHTACSLVDSAKRESAGASSNKQNNTQFSSGSHRRQRDGYHSYQNNKGRPTDSALEDCGTFPGRDDNIQERQNSKSDTCNSRESETNPRTQNRWPRKRWDRKAPDKGRRSSVDSDEQLQKTTGALSRLSVSVCKSDDVQLERGAVEVLNDSGSSEQKRVKQSGLRHTSACSRSKGTQFQRRRNDHGRQDDTHLTKESVVSGDRQTGPDRASGSLHLQKEQHVQRSSGNQYGSRRTDREDRKPVNSRNTFDNQSDRVERQPQSPSTSGHPPGFRVQHRPASATVQQPPS